MMIRPRRRAAQQRRGRERAHSLGSILSRAYAAPVLQPPQQARSSPRIAAASKRPKGCLTLGKSTAVAAAAVAVFGVQGWKQTARQHDPDYGATDYGATDFGDFVDQLALPCLDLQIGPSSFRLRDTGLAYTPCPPRPSYLLLEDLAHLVARGV